MDIGVIAWLIACIAALSALVVLINTVTWPAAKSSLDSRDIRVSVLVPARNEESRIAQCLDTVLTQGEVVGEVLVYNDHSTDATGRIVDEFSRRDARVRTIDSLPLPADWCGKNYACFRLAHAARSPWLLFIDADVRLSPGAVEAAVSEALQRDATMVSLWPRISVGGFWEKILMPMLNFVVFTAYPSWLALKRPDASFGLAHGACILAHRDTYMRVGGHEVVRDEIFEDTRLARAWRQCGHSSICLDGQELVCVRMYESLGEIWRGFQKNFYTAFHSRVMFWFFLLVHACVFTFPFFALPVCVVRGGGYGAWAISVISIIAARFALAMRFRQPAWTALFHPIAQTVLIALGLSSCWRCVTGKGVEWKGRSYRSEPAVHQ
ncbi:MAG: glycosyltransferase [Candidatus Hydrogenedentes bacterium]|nr:glycosyltransferase [Candidatus Hydrogenedentota bacterium]